MSLRIPPPSADDPAHAGAGPPTNPFATGPGGFILTDDAEKPASRFSGIAVVLIVIVCAGLVLLGMRKLGMGPKLGLLEIQIDYPVDGATGGAGADHERVLDDLRTGGRVNRVPLELVQANPFEWRLPAAAEARRAETDPAELSRREQEERRKRAADAASRLQLNSVMAGRVPVARISGVTVRIGDTVAEIFTVRAIDGRTVTLESEGQQYRLSLGE